VNAWRHDDLLRQDAANMLDVPRRYDEAIEANFLGDKRATHHRLIEHSLVGSRRRILSESQEPIPLEVMFPLARQHDDRKDRRTHARTPAKRFVNALLCRHKRLGSGFGVDREHADAELGRCHACFEHRLGGVLEFQVQHDSEPEPMSRSDHRGTIPQEQMMPDLAVIPNVRQEASRPPERERRRTIVQSVDNPNFSFHALLLSQVK
jgi:hypothetical protein